MQRVARAVGAARPRVEVVVIDFVFEVVRHEVGLVRRRFVRALQPHALAEMLRSRDSLWVVLAVGLYLIAVADDAHLFGWQANPPYEEVLELSAAICLAVFALQRLAGQRRRS